MVRFHVRGKTESHQELVSVTRKRCQDEQAPTRRGGVVEGLTAPSFQQCNVCNMTCPICKKPTIWEGNPWRPFCSERCQIIDLGTWAAELYRFPGKEGTVEPAESDTRQDG
jgi:hypothetical protein